MTPATLRFLRMSPRKVRVVGDAIRGVSVTKAMNYLNFSRRRAAKPMAKLLKSAVVNASRQKGVDIDRLFVKTLQVDVGPTVKRSLPRARGMATPILKRTSHIKISLGEK